MHSQRKVLLAYASRHGSTAEVAQAMAESLRGNKQYQHKTNPQPIRKGL